MDVKIANAMYGYLETLYLINQRLIRLCGADVIDDFEDNSKIVLDIIQDIPRIVPYSYNNNKEILEFDKRNGLLEFQDNITFLMDDYENILDNNYVFLDKVRKIRNKYEHKMHGVKHKASGSGSFSLFDFSFEINDNIVNVEAKEFISLIKMLNSMFSKIVKEIQKYAYENEKTDYLYYRRISRFDFEDFNKIFESEDLRNIGKSMKDF